MIETEMQDGTIIEVVDVSGTSGNAAQHVINRGVQGVEFIYMNTDAQTLRRSTASCMPQLGSTGPGADAKPEAGRHCAEETHGQIADALRDAHMVSITAGMGDSTGTGAVLVVAQVTKKMDILTVGIVSRPFDFESARRSKVGEHDANDLEGNVDSLIVVLNGKLFEVMGDDTGVDRYFQYADDVLHNTVTDIAEIINIDGLVNIDSEDVKTMMGEQGRAMMGTTTVSGVDRARLTAEQAMANPLLEDMDLSGARGVLINITASRSLRLSRTKEVMNTIRSYAAENATAIFGTIYDSAMGDTPRVTVATAGLGRAIHNKQQQPQTMTLLKTSTDNRPVTFGGGAGHSVIMTPDHGNFDTLAVWCSSRESASAHMAAL